MITIDVGMFMIIIDLLLMIELITRDVEDLDPVHLVVDLRGYQGPGAAVIVEEAGAEDLVALMLAGRVIREGIGQLPATR